MSEREITYAGVAYFDRTRALADGSITPPGCKLRFLPFPSVGDLFRRMAQDAEFDAAEMSLSTFMLMRGRGDDRLVGIPVFPSRAFRHGQVDEQPVGQTKRGMQIEGRFQVAARAIEVAA